MIGRTFAIALNPSRYTEHRDATLRQFDKKFCTLTEQLRGPLYITNLHVDLAQNEKNDYVQDGFLVVKVDQDGHLL